MEKRVAWNKSLIIGQKAPLKQQEIWAIRTRLEIAKNTRELAMLNLAIYSKLRGCDLVSLKVSDVMRSGEVLTRTSIVQHKTGTPVQFELTPQTRKTVKAWVESKTLKFDDFLFPSRKHNIPHMTTRAYDRIVHKWVESIGLDSSLYGTHSMRRTKVSTSTSAIKTSGQFSCCLVTRKSKVRSGTWELTFRMRLRHQQT